MRNLQAAEENLQTELSFLFCSINKIEKHAFVYVSPAPNEISRFIIDFFEFWFFVESWPMPEDRLKFVHIMIIEWTNRLAFRITWLLEKKEKRENSFHLNELKFSVKNRK